MSANTHDEAVLENNKLSGIYDATREGEAPKTRWILQLDKVWRAVANGVRLQIV